MIALQLDDLRQHSDMLRLRTGKSVMVRLVEPRDAEALQGYFRSLSVGSRYNRFLGAMSELPQTQLDHFTHVGEADRFTVIATMPIDGIETIVGEARYAFDADTSS
ncbi:MAG TPA: GNAT family N-acetyltransferase, partial [Bradyrhizobium sp.]|nr:GNAT family N-acetyltransferase [Bradyrhizobium sp.]